jgi:alpha-tubulin suppressor-like RCC1 family protein/beta-lactam-binding protein with PASTA domain
VDQARATIAGLGLEVDEAKHEYEYDDAIAKGLVIGTRPEAGVPVERGQEIVLVVSKGPPPVRVPPIAEGATIEQATEVLESSGLQVSALHVPEDHKTVAVDRVIRTDPVAGTEVEHRSVVTLVVSRGPPPVRVPEGLVGSTEEQALDALEKVGLKGVPHKDRVFDPIVPEGCVIETQPASGETVQYGSEVKLAVSNGPDPGGDADGDGLPHNWEIVHGYDPDRKDTDGNGIPDGEEDPDNDCRDNLAELSGNTDPNTPDKVQVPSLVGSISNNPQEELGKYCLLASVIDEFSDEPEGQVLSISGVNENEEVDPWTTVTVIRSKGPCEVPFPAVESRTAREVTDDLQRLCEQEERCVEVKLQFEVHEHVQEGEVIGSDRTTGERIPCGQRVNLVVSSGPERHYIAIAATGNHTCAVTRQGAVKCWGRNAAGQLGDGTTTDAPIPVRVSELNSVVTVIAAKGSHTCALTSAGGVRCWGSNDHGQLGDRTYLNRRSPVDVYGLNSGVTAIAAGGEHTCALTSTGGVKCWGKNYYGQLGDGTTTDRFTPVDVTDLGSGVIAITAGGEHTCALTSAGGVKCWGYNGFGQLGDGTEDNSREPVDASGLTSDVAAVAAGSWHTCAIIGGTDVRCWGYNGLGQLGDGTTVHQPTWVRVSGLNSSVTSIAPGTFHTCALTSWGGVLCWGGNAKGYLGDGTTIDRFTPELVDGLGSDVTAIAVGGSHTCALLHGGEVKCWGGNSDGQLGDGTTIDRHTPVDVLPSGVP